MSLQLQLKNPTSQFSTSSQGIVTPGECTARLADRPGSDT